MEEENVENSSFLVEMEAKIPHILYTKWEEEKLKLKTSDGEITIRSFIQFYTNLVNIEEKAQYLRNKVTPMTEVNI